jgi:hypothetical protein
MKKNLKKIEEISQVLIMVLSCAAIILITLPAGCPWQRWGYVVGLLAQPFWLYTAIYHKQTGVFWSCYVYTVIWLLGILTRFW